MPTEQFTLAKPTKLNGAISATATTLTTRDQPTWPTSGQFRVRVGFGQANEEIMIVAGGAGFGWTILQRGAEGSTPAAHNDWEPVVEVLTPGGLSGLISAQTNVFSGADPNGMLFMIWYYLHVLNLTN